MKLKFFLLLFFFTITFDSKAQNYLNIYECSSRNYVESCSKKCKKTDLQISFLIDKSAGNVMRRIVSLDTKEQSSKSKTGCRIFNEKNWDCSGQLVGSAEHLLQSVDMMTDGIYVFYLRNIRNGSDQTTDFYCGK